MAKQTKPPVPSPNPRARQARGIIKPTQKPIREYYQSLQAYGDRGVRHEGALETAFQRLLSDTAGRAGWMLVPKQRYRLNGTILFPDGTLFDSYNLPRGYWEAKDTDDDLEAEIRKKSGKGYPLTNTIFEDTRQAVLFQDKQEALRIDLTDATKLSNLLNQFYAWTKPEYAKFDRAVEDFKDRVPELARGLAEKIKLAHKDNATFQVAFDHFFALCKTALNVNIRQEAVDEMLVQHLLTERVIRKSLDDSEFFRRNVIAVEVEKVIDALVSKTFSRDEFQKSLAPFYAAIEGAARTIPEFSDKQHFLRTIYERFFQGYSVKLADTHGIVYTPEPIVDFMCASVEEVLRDEFGLTLGSPEVTILDPCTGTGNFVMNLIRRVPGKALPRVYKEQLFANEVMLLPYYIAALNIEHAYYERTRQYEAFEGMCFVDTLDLAREHGVFGFMTEKNTERVERQKRTPITVIIGNPPYNVGQLNENDNNKNRKYTVIDRRIKETYGKASKATLNTKLYDPYVKFFRWAIDRLEGRDGIVCLITNNSFVDQIAFDGMRQHLMQDFTSIYHLHLEGNVRQNPTLSGTAYNVFGIQVGVGITLAIRCAQHKQRRLYFERVEKTLRRDEKHAWLAKHEKLSGVNWQELTPDCRHTWLVAGNANEFTSFLALGTKEAKAATAPSTSTETIFRTYSLGVSTNRDSVVYDWDRELLAKRVDQFSDDYVAEMNRFIRKGSGKALDDFLDYSKVKWSRNLKPSLRNQEQLEFDETTIRRTLYRPFSKLFLYFADIAVDELGQLPRFFPTDEQQNVAIAVTMLGSEKPFMTLTTDHICDLHLVGAGAGTQCFPFYVYDEDGSNRRENITDWALTQFRQHYDDAMIGKKDIFHYVYGLLHHPGYRTKFADNLKRDLPRIPFAPDFRAFAVAGRELARLHLDYEKLEPYPLDWLETPDVPLSYRVEDKMRLSKDKTAVVVNPSLTLAGIPQDTFQYRLGNRSALEWVIDQYQVTEDKRSGTRSDPNRADDKEYIVDLVGQIVQVSVKTVAIIDQLPEEWT